MGVRGSFGQIHPNVIRQVSPHLLESKLEETSNKEYSPYGHYTTTRTVFLGRD